MLRTLTTCFPVMFTPDIARILGVSQTSVHRKARELGLHKCEDFAELTYDLWRKRTSERTKAKSNPGQFTKGQHASPATEFKKGHVMSPELQAKRNASNSATRKRVIQEERRRVVYGLPQKTNINLGRAFYEAHHYIRTK